MTRLRDDAVGKPGAHAHGAQAREGSRRPRRSSANGGSISPSSARPRRPSASSCRHGGDVMADLPIKELGDEAPVYDRPCVDDAEAAGDRWPRASSRRCRIADALREADRLARPLLASAGCGSSTTTSSRATRVQRPGGDAAVVRVNDGPKALALTADVTPRYCEADPFEGGKQAVAEAWRNLTAVGAQAAGGHRQPQLRQSRAARDHGPVGRLRPRHRRGLQGARLPDRVRQRLALQRDQRPRRSCRPRPSAASACSTTSPSRRRSAFKAAGEAILLIGETQGWLGQSLYLRDICGREDGAPPPVDLRSRSARTATSCAR